MKQEQLTNRSFRIYTVLACIFAGAVVAANLMGTKVIDFFSIGGYQFSGSVGIFLFPLTFLVTDIVAEVYGGRATRAMVSGTLFTLVLVLAATAFATVVPPAGRFAAQNQAYVSIFSGSARILVASIVAFTISQYHDIWAFNLWKSVTRGRHLWLRNNASTMVSQLIDSAIFLLIAFWGVTERFTLGYVLGSMLPPYYVIKIIAALFDTPLVYLGVRFIQRYTTGERSEHAAAPAG